MARKEIGHVELQWTCPNCGGINPGPVKTCQSCGAPQPEDVQFEQPARQDLVTDEDKIAQAQAGADIHCPYCGTRNPAGAETCKQCGGDLAEGTRREVGRVVGAYTTGPATMVACPRCGAENPDTARNCQQCGAPMQPELEKPAPIPATQPTKKSFPWLVVGGVIAVIAICALLYLLFFSTDNLTGTVQSVNWERSIPIEAFGPVLYETWLEEIPSGAQLGACEERYHHTQNEPAPNAVEVCGTPYTVDTGGGFGEVVQDCEYEVYQDYCEYTVDEWSVVDAVTISGNDFNAYWPEPELGYQERLGSEREETYVIVFATDNGIERYTTSNYELFQEAQIGTTWTLEINQIGGVVGIEK